jgi:hypothetical protein
MDELTNWPKESGEYKIVQMEVHGKPCLRFATASGEWGELHSEIIDFLVNHLGKKTSRIIGKYKFEIPALESDWYKVLGAGKSYVDIENKEASFYGKSKDYDIGISLEHLESIKPLYSEWSIKKE